MALSRPLTAHKDSTQTADLTLEFLMLKAILKLFYCHCSHSNKSMFVGNPRRFLEGEET